MIKATRERLGDDGITYVKVDGIKLAGIKPGSIDVCFSFDTMVHMEPRDIFNYLTQSRRYYGASACACSITGIR